ncbi:MAG: DNA recombination protein RmuC [Bryobacteraceae bacterium]
MQQIWLAMAIAVGVAFGFLIAWWSMRSERATVFARGKAEGEQEKVALEERVAAKDVRLQEIQREWAQERELLAQINEENEELRAAREDLDARFAEMQRQAEQKIAAAVAGQERAADQAKQSWSEKVFEQEARLRTVEAELGQARGEAETLRGELAAALAGQPAVDASQSAAQAATAEELAATAQELATARERVAALEAERDEANGRLQALREEKVRLETTNDALVDKLEAQEVRLAELKTAGENARQEKEALQSEAWRLQAACAEWEARLGETRRVMEERQAAASQNDDRLAELVKAASFEAFQANQHAVLQMTQAALEQLQSATQQIAERQAAAPAATSDSAASAQPQAETGGAAIEAAIRPLRESLERVDAALYQIDRNRAQDIDGLSGQVKDLLGALRAPAAPSRWNGMHLRQVVELAGIGRHCDYTVAEGHDRSDLTIQLPGGRFLSVDAKAPVGAYLESLRVTDPDERERKLQEHSVSLRGHIENLGQGNPAAGRAPEFTVAFVPNEGFLSAVLERQPDLIEEAAARRVYLASPATLIALLKVVSHGWRQEQLAEQTQMVRELGKSLYERLCGFVTEMEGVSENLSRTVEGYNRAMGSLENRVLRGARRFAEADAADELLAPTPVNLTARKPREIEKAPAGAEAPLEALGESLSLDESLALAEASEIADAPEDDAVWNEEDAVQAVEEGQLYGDIETAVEEAASATALDEATADEAASTSETTAAVAEAPEANANDEIPTEAAQAVEPTVVNSVADPDQEEPSASLAQLEAAVNEAEPEAPEPVTEVETASAEEPASEDQAGDEAVVFVGAEEPVFAVEEAEAPPPAPRPVARSGFEGFVKVS